MKESTKIIILFSAFIMAIVLLLVIMVVAPLANGFLAQWLLFAIGFPASLALLFGSLGNIINMKLSE